MPLLIREFTPADTEAVVALWDRCGLTRPWNDPYKDIQRKLRNSPTMFLIGEAEHRIVAAAMVGYDGHRGWIYYLGVDPERRREGFGRAMFTEAEQRLRALGCPKINLQVRTTNTGVIEFYRRLGFTVDDVVSLGKRLEHDGPPSVPVTSE